MKQIPCSNDSCSNRRIHHEQQDVMRPHRMVDVEDDYPYLVAFCSITCACISGYYNVRTGWLKDPMTGEPTNKE